MLAFLWGSSENHRRYHLISWQKLSWHKEYEGWGIKNLHWFSISLRLKNIWMALLKGGLWHHVPISKYLKNISVIDWLRNKRFSTRRVSIIWRGFLETLPWLGSFLAWQVGDGKDITIGVDPIIGAHSSYILPEELRTFLEDLDISTLSQAHNILHDAQDYWYMADELGLEGSLKEAWNAYTEGLVNGGIHLSSLDDSLVWDFNKKEGTISAKYAYECIVNSYSPPVGTRTDSLLSNSALPRKIGCFIWLVIRNKILTWDNLQKRGRSGPGICALCYSDEETVSHLFSKCIVWKTVLGHICDQFQLPCPPLVDSPSSFVRNWADNYLKNPTLRSIPFHMMWIIWKARNLAIFEGKKRNVLSIVHQITYSVQTYSSQPVKVKNSRR